jgi:hypothetical protein
MRVPSRTANAAVLRRASRREHDALMFALNTPSQTPEERLRQLFRFWLNANPASRVERDFSRLHLTELGGRKPFAIQNCVDEWA